MASLAGPAGLLQGLVEGERRKRERRLQDEERRRQEEQRERERKLQRLQLLLQATENPAIVPRGVTGGAGDRRRGGGQGPAGTTVVGRGPAESTRTRSPLTEAAPLLSLADRARRGEAPGQESAPPGGALTLASEAVETRDRSRGRPSPGRGGRVLGLGALNDLLGRSGEREFVYDPSRTTAAREERAAELEARESRERKAAIVNEIMRLEPEEFDRDNLMDLSPDQAWSLLQDVQDQHFEEQQTAAERRREREEQKAEEARENRLDRAKDVVFRAASRGRSLDEAMAQLDQERLAGVIDEREARLSFKRGRDMLTQRSQDKARSLISEEGGGDEAVRHVWERLSQLENPTLAEQKLIGAVREIADDRGVTLLPPAPEEEDDGDDIPFIPGI